MFGLTSSSSTGLDIKRFLGPFLYYVFRHKSFRSCHNSIPCLLNHTSGTIFITFSAIKTNPWSVLCNWQFLYKASNILSLFASWAITVITAASPNSPNCLSSKRSSDLAVSTKMDLTPSNYAIFSKTSCPQSLCTRAEISTVMTMAPYARFSSTPSGM